VQVAPKKKTFDQTQPFPRNSFAVSGPKKPKAFSGRKRLAKIILVKLFAKQKGCGQPF